jgi:hypothetical protein
VRIIDEMSFKQHKDYIENNPVKAGLASSPEDYQHGSALLKKQKLAAAEARKSSRLGGTTQVVP